MSNYIAAWGPSGPMYLEKTKEEGIYHVINGDWDIDIEDIDFEDKYYIIKDNFINENYNTACDTIREMYNEDCEYHILHPVNHTPYMDSADKLKKLNGVTEEMYNELPKHNFKIKTPDAEIQILSEDINSSNEISLMAKHFDTPLPLTEVNISVIKQLIAKGYTIPKKEKLMSPETSIVTVETVNLVNGVDVTELNANDLLNSVIQLEANIKKLVEIEVKSEFVTNTILKQMKVLDTVVKHLDAKG